MNDYTVGCLEALSYSMAVLSKHDGGGSDAYHEISEAAMKVLEGTALTFQDRLKMIKTDLPKKV